MEVKKGRPLKGRPAKTKLKRLYVREGKSIREIANLTGHSKDMIYRALTEYGIEKRASVKRSRLRVYDLGFLKRAVRKRGYKATARELDINEWTLRAYLKER